MSKSVQRRLAAQKGEPPPECYHDLKRTISINGVNFPTGFDKKAPPRKKSPWRELVQSMVPGQWIDFPDISRKTRLYNAAMYLGMKITTKKLPNGGFRCWRV